MKTCKQYVNQLQYHNTLCYKSMPVLFICALSICMTVALIFTLLSELLILTIDHAGSYFSFPSFSYFFISALPKIFKWPSGSQKTVYLRQNLFLQNKGSTNPIRVDRHAKICQLYCPNVNQMTKYQSYPNFDSFRRYSNKNYLERLYIKLSMTCGLRPLTPILAKFVRILAPDTAAPDFTDFG